MRELGLRLQCFDFSLCILLRRLACLDFLLSSIRCASKLDKSGMQTEATVSSSLRELAFSIFNDLAATAQPSATPISNTSATIRQRTAFSTMTCFAVMVQPSAVWILISPPGASMMADEARPSTTILPKGVAHLAH